MKLNTRVVALLHLPRVKDGLTHGFISTRNLKCTLLTRMQATYAPAVDSSAIISIDLENDQPLVFNNLS